MYSSAEYMFRGCWSGALANHGEAAQGPGAHYSCGAAAQIIV